MANNADASEHGIAIIIGLDNKNKFTTMPVKKKTPTKTS